ncbi:MAG: nitroreductase family protein [Thermoplasmata archaeon]|nr:nitroreductase family protein [Thermoplasmata archaeon]
MEPHLRFDEALCIGCSACVSVCIRGNIRMEMGRPVETGGGMGCFDCGHCLAVCPKGAVMLLSHPGFVPGEYDPKEAPVDPSDLQRLLARRRSVRWFTQDKVTREEFDTLLSAASNVPTVQNSQDVAFAVVDSEFRPFMRHIASIMAPRADELPRIRQLIDYLDDPFPMGPNPLTWEGSQLILAFSREPEDAVIAMTRVEIMAYAMGLGGFYSHWIQMADAQDHDALMGFFPDIPEDHGLRSVFVIGHPRVRFRRTAPRDGPRVSYL